jgi:flavodoxin
MDPVVVYFSRTGNTQRLAQAISDATDSPLMNIDGTLPSTIETFDPLILGTPVEGASPAKETAAFLEGVNRKERGKAILFCTFRLFGNKRTLKAMEKELKKKGYEVVLKVSKKGIKPEKEADFTEIISQIKNTLMNLR